MPFQIRVLEQVQTDQLIARMREAGECPGAKRAGISETATLSYSIPLFRDAVTFAQTEAAKAMPLYDGAVWKITLQTYKVAPGRDHAGQPGRRARPGARQAPGEIDRLGEDLGLRTREFQDALAINAGLQAELAAAQARIAELEARGPQP